MEAHFSHAYRKWGGISTAQWLRSLINFDIRCVRLKLRCALRPRTEHAEPSSKRPSLDHAKKIHELRGEPPLGTPSTIVRSRTDRILCHLTRLSRKEQVEDCSRPDHLQNDRSNPRKQYPGWSTGRVRSEVWTTLAGRSKVKPEVSEKVDPTEPCSNPQLCPLVYCHPYLSSTLPYHTFPRGIGEYARRARF